MIAFFPCRTSVDAIEDFPVARTKGFEHSACAPGSRPALSFRNAGGKAMRHRGGIIPSASRESQLASLKERAKITKDQLAGTGAIIAINVEPPDGSR
jgi:hypothetical protein